MKSLVIIPARYASTRFPGKPLIPLLGKPLVIWAAEIAAEAVGEESVYVATDDCRIQGVVEGAGFRTVFTETGALTGTDRVAEAADLLPRADVYVNLQGDEPLVNKSDILRVIELKSCIPDVVNCFAKMDFGPYAQDRNVPKVVTGEGMQLLYMSRALIPMPKSASSVPDGLKKQVCIYGYSYDQLEKFRSLGRKTPLESIEDIEILRFIEMGINVRMLEVEDTSLAVDVPGDVPLVEEALLKRGVKASR